MTSLAERWLRISPNRWRMSTLWMPDSAFSVAFSLLRVLAVAHRQRLAVAPLVQALAEEHRFAARYRLRLLADRLIDQTPLVAALEQTSGLLSDEQVLTLRFATEMGCLDDAYEKLLNDAGHQNFDAARRIRQSLVYGVVLGVANFSILNLLMLFIAPTFKEMYEEFGMDIPATFNSLITFFDSSIGFLPLTILAGFLVAVVAWLVKPFRVFRRTLASRVVPMSAKLRTVQLLELLSMSLRNGRPMPGALSSLARYHFDQNLRQRLLFARNEVEQGTDAWNSLWEARLLEQNEAHALSEASSNRLRAWTMELLAGKKKTEAETKHAFWSALIHPAIVLCFGLFIAWVCVSFFGVLTNMIHWLA